MPRLKIVCWEKQFERKAGYRKTYLGIERYFSGKLIFLNWYKYSIVMDFR